MDLTPPREIKKEDKEEITVNEVDQFIWKVPICCREGWDSCKHVLKKENKRTKSNIGL